MSQKDNNSEISFTWDKESEGYYKRHKLSNGQWEMVKFIEHKKRTDAAQEEGEP